MPLRPPLRAPGRSRRLGRATSAALVAIVLVAWSVGAWAASPVPSPVPSPAVGLPSPTPTPAPLPDRLRATLDTWRRDARVPAVVAAMRLPDGSVWRGAKGTVEVGRGMPPATTSTPWVIGSITKTFVAALALQLQDEGRLSLDDPIATWIDWRRDHRITLRMLLDHTSGVADYFWHPRYERLVFKRPTWHWTVDEILALAADRKPAFYFKPGAGYFYSNSNYILAGRILEIAGGAPLAEQLRTRFFQPLGLTSAVFQGDEPVPPGAPIGYLREDRTWKPLVDGTNLRPTTSAATVAWAAGAVLLSADDLLRWEEALYGGEVLSPAALDQMLDFGADGYGLAARTQDLAGWDGLGHGGSLRGFVAVMYRVPAADVAVVVLTNRGSVDLNGLAADLVREVIGTPTSPVPWPAPSPSPDGAMAGGTPVPGSPGPDGMAAGGTPVPGGVPASPAAASPAPAAGAGALRSRG